MQTMTASRAKRKQSKSPRLRKANVTPMITADELDARKEALRKIAGSTRMGRPPIYETAEELQAAIDNYFIVCEEKAFLPTVAGLQYHIGMYSGNIWDEIARRGDDFSSVAKGTLLRMQDYKFQAAASGAMDRSVYIFDAVNHHNHVNTRTESKNDNRNSGRLEIEAIAISLVRPDHTQPIIAVPKANPQISANDIEPDSGNANDVE